MAHFRGLRTEHVYRRSYRKGIDQYVDFALALMRRKDFPEHLVEEMRDRYATEAGVEEMRKSATLYTEQAFGVDTGQLVCMVYSPFAGEAVHLHDYLAAEHPELLADEAEIRAVLAGETENAEVAAELARISGLNLDDMRSLYRGPLWSAATEKTSTGLFANIMASDPHQRKITAKRNPEGDEILDRVAGR